VSISTKLDAGYAGMDFINIMTFANQSRLSS